MGMGLYFEESEDFLIYDVPEDGQCFFHALSLAITVW
jgi:hypothetical protein